MQKLKIFEKNKSIEKMHHLLLYIFKIEKIKKKIRKRIFYLYF